MFARHHGFSVGEDRLQLTWMGGEELEVVDELHAVVMRREQMRMDALGRTHEPGEVPRRDRLAPQQEREA